jgi:hypothetical protein
VQGYDIDPEYLDAIWSVNADGENAAMLIRADAGLENIEFFGSKFGALMNQETIGIYNIFEYEGYIYYILSGYHTGEEPNRSSGDASGAFSTKGRWSEL